MSRSLQQILDDSLASAGAAVKATFDKPERHVSAEEFRELWRETRMFAVATNSTKGGPHIAPVHVLLTDDDSLEMAIFEDSARLHDLRRDPHVSITTWAPDGRIAIVYGRCSEVEGSRREVTRDPGRFILTMRIEIDRVYAMRPRA
jgi:hypothetical protein